MVVAAGALVDIAAIGERLGQAAVELDRLVEVLERTASLAHRCVGLAPQVERRCVVRFDVDRVIEFADGPVVLRRS